MDEKPETQAQKDAKAWAEAEKQLREDEIKTRQARIEDAVNLKVEPNHPLHPSKATNPSNITSPADHGPAKEPFEMWQGEP